MFLYAYQLFKNQMLETDTINIFTVVNNWRPLCEYGLILIPEWISKVIQHKCRLNYLSIPIWTVQVWKWMNNSTPQLIMDVITYPCWH